MYTVLNYTCLLCIIAKSIKRGRTSRQEEIMTRNINRYMHLCRYYLCGRKPTGFLVIGRKYLYHCYTCSENQKKKIIFPLTYQNELSKDPLHAVIVFLWSLNFKNYFSIILTTMIQKSISISPHHQLNAYSIYIRNS